MRRLLTRRWLGYLGLTVAFAIACSLLGLWQWSRNEQKQAAVDLVNRNWDAAAAPLERELPTLAAFDPRAEWRPVQLHGTYLRRDQLLVRNRVYGDDPGFVVLTPLRLDDGRVFVVDRGWVPTGARHDSPDSVPAPPTGEVTVVARLQAGEPALAGRTAPHGQLQSIHLPSVAALTGTPTYTGAYGILDAESPAVSDMPLPTVRPEPDLGPHLSYMFQWFAFGVLGFVGLGWAVRQERRALEAERAERAGVHASARGGRIRRRSDAEEEDALLDSTAR